MFGIEWHPTKYGFFASKDARYASIGKYDDGRWFWIVTYEGETDKLEGVAKTAKAAKVQAGRHLM